MTVHIAKTYNRFRDIIFVSLIVVLSVIAGILFMEYPGDVEE